VYSWYALPAEAATAALTATVRAVNPRARCEAVTPRGTERAAWQVVIDAMAAPADTPREVSMVANSTTAAFAFRPPA
jgi:hypothetical protein